MMGRTGWIYHVVVNRSNNFVWLTMRKGKFLRVSSQIWDWGGGGGVVVSLLRERHLTIIWNFRTGVFISWIWIGLVIWQWILVVRGGGTVILVKWSRCLIHRRRHFVIFLNFATVGEGILVVMVWSLVNCRGTVVARRESILIIGRRGILISGGRGILVISLCRTIRVWILWRSRLILVWKGYPCLLPLIRYNGHIFSFLPE